VGNNDILTGEFAVIDVETANPDCSSICQIGVIRCRGEEIVEEDSTLINPETWFDPFCVGKHKINEEMVRGAPTFLQWSKRLNNFLDGMVVLMHGHFDRTAVSKACKSSGVSTPNATWLNNIMVARRAWPEMDKSKGGEGYGLDKVCAALNFEFRHHDALQDARAALHIFIEASNAAGLDVSEWIKRVRQPVDLERAGNLQDVFATEGNPNGPLWGEVVVFTGALSMRREDAARAAQDAGCKVDPRVTKKGTTMLVFGDQYILQLAEGKNKHTKHRNAEKWGIRVVRESDFMAMINESTG